MQKKFILLPQKYKKNEKKGMLICVCQKKAVPLPPET